MLIRQSDAYMRYEEYVRIHTPTRVDPLRTYSGWLHENGIDIISDDDEMFEFTERPVVKSSTNVLQATICQKCGHKFDGKIGGNGEPCNCKCHDGRI